MKVQNFKISALLILLTGLSVQAAPPQAVLDLIKNTYNPQIGLIFDPD